MSIMFSMEANNIIGVSGVSDLTDKALLRPSRVAAILDLSRSAVYEKISSGELPSVRIGRSVRVPAEAIRRLLEEAR
jgi:excisionase family DNA binding protein